MTILINCWEIHDKCVFLFLWFLCKHLTYWVNIVYHRVVMCQKYTHQMVLPWHKEKATCACHLDVDKCSVDFHYWLELVGQWSLIVIYKFVIRHQIEWIIISSFDYNVIWKEWNGSYVNLGADIFKLAYSIIVTCGRQLKTIMTLIFFNFETKQPHSDSLNMY